MKKKFVSIMVISVLLGGVGSGLFSVDAHAEETPTKKIESVQELENAIEEANGQGENDSKQLKDQIINNTDSEVLEKYTAKEEEAINQKIDELANKTELDVEADSNSFYEKHEETKLDDGTVIEAITSDSPAIEQPQISLRATSTKKYGSRVYTVKLRVYHVLYPDGWTVLNTYYNVGSSGLTATSTSAAGTKSIFPLQISKHTKVTDKRAEKVGYDINGQGDYGMTYLGANGIGIAYYERTIRSTVKLTKLSKSKKTAQVKTSYTKQGS